MKIFSLVLRTSKEQEDEAQPFIVIFSDRPNRHGLFNARIMDDTNHEIISTTGFSIDEISIDIKKKLNKLGHIISINEIVSDDATKEIIKKLRGDQ